MNILIADDHELVRNGIAKIVAEEYPEAKISEVSRGIEAEEKVRAGKWDLLIMDMSMPDKTGLEVLKQLRKESIKVPVLILSICAESQYWIRVLKAGGNGFISKGCEYTEFVAAMRNVLNGKKYISFELTEKFASEKDDSQKEASAHIATVNAPSQIAGIVTLKVPTVGSYYQRLLEKMKIKKIQTS
jgi:two-component system, NarL family, invasion response regulator UvrY